MKQLFVTFFLTIIFIACMNVQPALALEENIPVFIDGLPVSLDVPPAMQNGRILVPFRAIAEALNVEVNWDGKTQKISAAAGEDRIELTIGSKTAYHNLTPILLDVGPQIIDGRTLIPLRFFGTALGCTVNWVENSREVQISSPPTKMYVTAFYALGDSRTSSWTDLFGLPYPESAKGNTDIVGTLSLGWYSLDKDGNLLTESSTGWKRPEGWENVLLAAEKYALETEMVIHVTDADGTISSLLASEEAMNRAIAAIIKEAEMYGGVNLNFEGLGLSQRGEKLSAVQDKFTFFVTMLSGQLRKIEKDLTLTVHPLNSEYKGYDYGGLAQAAGRIIIMAYDYGPKPEPINLVRQAVEAAKSYVPSEKLLLGISIPYETPVSIAPKIGLAKRYNLGGIALWRLGVISGETWDVLRLMVQKK
ncbi:MAG: copper amine oxidase [Firmicutes bacterium]|nr:copper amine oxidase [Bacillota bacterium]